MIPSSSDKVQKIDMIVPEDGNLDFLPIDELEGKHVVERNGVWYAVDANMVAVSFVEPIHTSYRDNLVAHLNQHVM